MTARKPPRRVTATRSRRVTVEETEAVTVEEPPTQEYPVLRFAPGWDQVPRLDGPAIRQQRRLQVERAAEMVIAQAIEGDPADDGHAVQTAANLLRAGPGAGAMELLYGRY